MTQDVRPQPTNAAASAVRELLEVGGSALRLGAVLVGGLSLLMYTKEIGRFPAGIGLGEGLAFYLVSAAFVLYYAIYWAAVTAVGSVLMRWPVEWLLRLEQRRRKAAGDPGGIPPNTTLVPMTGAHVCAVAVIGLVFYALITIRGGLSLATFTAPSVQGSMVALWVLLSRRSEFDRAELVLPGLDAVKDWERRRQMPLVRRFVAVMLLVWPWFSMPNSSDAVHSAFATAQLRREGATAHVQTPWSRLLLPRHGAAEPSALGPPYIRIECIDVLLYGIGDVVVVDRASWRRPDRQGHCPRVSSQQGRQPVAVPARAVWIE